jgi:hypothetical protein
MIARGEVAISAGTKEIALIDDLPRTREKNFRAYENLG